MLIGLVFLSPAMLVLSCGLRRDHSSSPSVRRQALMKVVFNVASIGLSAAVAGRRLPRAPRRAQPRQPPRLGRRSRRPVCRSGDHDDDRRCGS